MITPGPVVITVAFIGFLVAGFGGASAAALGVFLPCYLFVVIPAPYYHRIADKPVDQGVRRRRLRGGCRRESAVPRSCSGPSRDHRPADDRDRSGDAAGTGQGQERSRNRW